MKIQIIKIIPCLLAGFILSACVGAVNLAEGVIAESKTEKTESETQTPEKLIIKEPEAQNKKVVEPVEPKPIISVETKPISANPCIANPFGDTCGGEEFNDAREAVCLTERESHRCRVIIPLVCEADSLDVLCAGDETYYPAQYSACIANKTDPRCTLTITRVCGANPLDYQLCGKLTAYYPAQKTACEEGYEDRCGPTIKRVCEEDVFHKVCTNYVAYLLSNYGYVYYKTGRYYSNCGRDQSGYIYRDGGKHLRACNAGVKTITKYHSAWETICSNEIDSERCTPIIAWFCSANALDTLCTGLATYYPAQKRACESEPNSERCRLTLARVCTDDIFNPYCANAEAYHPAQYAVCEDEPNSERCMATSERVCTDNIFNPYCANVESRNSVLYGACKSEYAINSERCAPTIARVCKADSLDYVCRGLATYFPAQKRVCESFQFTNQRRYSQLSNNSNYWRCKTTIDRVCGADAFDTLCTGLSGYHPARYAVCEDEPNSERCRETAERVCGEDVLDTLCTGLAQYAPEIKAACESDNADVRCPPIMASLCIDTPFDTACQASNLTYHDFNKILKDIVLIKNLSKRQSTARCFNIYDEVEGAYCRGYLPYIDADIKPLNDTNIGNATYTGDLKISYHDDNYIYKLRNDTREINLVVNFGDNSLSYSGIIGLNAFSINGNFTDRGHITGTANFRDTEATLLGLIGQTEMIGAFATGHVGQNNKAFAGGFIATREE